MRKPNIGYIVRVIDRLERLGWPSWKIEEAYQELLFRRARS